MEWNQLNIGSLNIDWATLVSLAAFVIAIGALIVVIAEMRRQKFIFGVKALMEINDYFHSSAMLAIRQKAAASLLNNTYDDNVENLFDFFEMVGYLSKRRAIKKQLVWNNISYWIIRYWYAARIYVEKERQKYPKRFENVTFLFRYISKMERKKYGVSIITQESINAFLENERCILNK